MMSQCGKQMEGKIGEEWRASAFVSPFAIEQDEDIRPCAYSLSATRCDVSSDINIVLL